MKSGAISGWEYLKFSKKWIVDEDPQISLDHSVDVSDELRGLK